MSKNKLGPMNPEADAKLVEILHKEEAALTEGDVAFLKARAPYVKEKHKDRYPSVFGKNADKVSKNAAKTKAKADKEAAKAEKAELERLGHPAAL